MRHSLFTLFAAAGSAIAQQGAYEQCGGVSFTGGTSCVSGYTCTEQNEYYSQCIPGAGDFQQSSAASSSACAVSFVSASSVEAQPTVSTSASAVASGGAGSSAVTSSSSAVTSSSAANSSSAATSSSAAAPTSSEPSSGGGNGKAQYAGINIAGFDFGCTTDGSCDLSSTDPPSNGNAQMKHFVNDDGLNAFRLPVAWQYLVNNQLGGTLDNTNFNTYDGLVQGCVDAGAELCIIDIHNYARWNGEIVGQSSGGPTDKDLASLWSQLATKYKSNSKIVFGIMNEPHDLDITTWATTVQASVTAIRSAGATAQKILLPGTDYTSAANFIDNGSGAALKAVTNPDGGTDNLIFDVHKYLDSDNSGTNAECATNNVDVFTTLGKWLQQNSRKAMLTETGGGSDASSCFTDLCQELATINSYSDVFLGWLGWAAGAFDTSYVLSETPTESGGTWTDQPLVTKCIVGQFH